MDLHHTLWLLMPLPTKGADIVNKPRMKLDLEFTPEETNSERLIHRPEIISDQEEFPPTKNQHPSTSNSDTCYGAWTAKIDFSEHRSEKSSRECWKHRIERKSKLCKERTKSEGFSVLKDKMLLIKQKEKGVTLDVELKLPRNREYVDEGPNVAAAFMANLSSTSGNNHHE
ncbi:hypothetical protein Tco_0596023 [Tanacetum coccineum]